MIESVEAALAGLAELDPARLEPDSGPVSSRRRSEDWWDVDDRLLLERIFVQPPVAAETKSLRLTSG